MNRYWRRRVAVGAAASGVVIAAALLASGPEPATDPRYGEDQCSSEDEILVELVEDPGEHRCVHVDYVFPAGGDPR